MEVFETGPTIVLPDGKAFCIGGTGKTAIYTPGPHPTSHGTWTKGPDFPNDTSGSPNWPLLTPLMLLACLLPNGKVVLMAGTTSPDSGDYFSLNPVLLFSTITRNRPPHSSLAATVRHSQPATLPGSPASCFCPQDRCCAARKATRSTSIRRILQPDRRITPGARPTSQFLRSCIQGRHSIQLACSFVELARGCGAYGGVQAGHDVEHLAFAGEALQ